MRYGVKSCNVVFFFKAVSTTVLQFGPRGPLK